MSEQEHIDMIAEYHRGVGEMNPKNALHVRMAGMNFVWKLLGHEYPHTAENHPHPHDDLFHFKSGSTMMFRVTRQESIKQRRRLVLDDKNPPTATYIGHVNVRVWSGVVEFKGFCTKEQFLDPANIDRVEAGRIYTPQLSNLGELWKLEPGDAPEAR